MWTKLSFHYCMQSFWLLRSYFLGERRRHVSVKGTSVVLMVAELSYLSKEEPTVLTKGICILHKYLSNLNYHNNLYFFMVFIQFSAKTIHLFFFYTSPCCMPFILHLGHLTHAYTTLPTIAKLLKRINHNNIMHDVRHDDTISHANQISHIQKKS